MGPVAIGLIVMGCTFGGALVGMGVRPLLPNHHFSDAAWDTTKLGIGLVATMTALLLGLVTAAAKRSFDDLEQAIHHSAAEILTLDRALARFGPEADEVRATVKGGVAHRSEATWPSDASKNAELESPEETAKIESVEDRIRALAPKNEAQRGLQTRALALIEKILESRWLILGSQHSSVPTPFLVALTFWLSVTFTIFGVFAPRNATVIGILLVCAFSVASAVFMILEMDGPFEGFLRVSADPLRYALSRLGQ